MSRRRRQPRVDDAAGDIGAADTSDSGTIELREEELFAHKEMRELGSVEVRTEIEDVPGRMEVDAYREEVVIEHEPVGQVVSEREAQTEEDGVLVIPIYEEQLTVIRRLVLRERVRVRRVGTTERQLFEDRLRRERLVVEDPQHTGKVREVYPTSEPEAESDVDEDQEPGFVDKLVRKALELPR
jgi:uncharacterized protein (TIGR02271 family)